MKIPWKMKSLIFSLIDRLDAPNLLYFLQKHVSRRSRGQVTAVLQNWVDHRDVLCRFDCTGFVFEFGAGKSLAQNIYLSSIVDRQLVVDLNPMVDLAYVNQAKNLLAAKVSLRSVSNLQTISDLKLYGIEYRAPYDAASTDLDDNCLDACISTNTLEHIPEESLRSIFREVRRVLKPTGVVSAKIDYTDHYAHTDPSISLLNFLNFSEAEWEKHNHACHYQNRLRHSDYRRLFIDCGFEVIEEKADFPNHPPSEQIARRFEGTDESWAALSGHFVLRKRSSS